MVHGLCLCLGHWRREGQDGCYSYGVYIIAYMDTMHAYT